MPVCVCVYYIQIIHRPYVIQFPRTNITVFIIYIYIHTEEGIPERKTHIPYHHGKQTTLVQGFFIPRFGSGFQNLSLNRFIATICVSLSYNSTFSLIFLRPASRYVRFFFSFFLCVLLYCSTLISRLLSQLLLFEYYFHGLFLFIHTFFHLLCRYRARRVCLPYHRLYTIRPYFMSLILLPAAMCSFFFGRVVACV